MENPGRYHLNHVAKVNIRSKEMNQYQGSFEGNNITSRVVLPQINNLKQNSNPLQYSCLENPMDGQAWCRLLSMGSQTVGHNWATSLHSLMRKYPRSKREGHSQYFTTSFCKVVNMKDKEQLSNLLVYRKPKIYMTTENNIWSKIFFCHKDYY